MRSSGPFLKPFLPSSKIISAGLLLPSLVLLPVACYSYVLMQRRVKEGVVYVHDNHTASAFKKKVVAYKRVVGCARRSLKDQFFQFSWRPRAPTLLSKEQEADVLKRLKEFSKRYDEEDSKILEEVMPPSFPPTLFSMHHSRSLDCCFSGLYILYI